MVMLMMVSSVPAFAGDGGSSQQANQVNQYTCNGSEAHLPILNLLDCNSISVLDNPGKIGVLNDLSDLLDLNDLL